MTKYNRISWNIPLSDFQVDTESEEYRLLNPVVSKLGDKSGKKRKASAVFKEIEVRLAKKIVCFWLAPKIIFAF